ncbi:MAG: hypothetical protein ACXVCV_25980, partial [Polyangia bacterium]
MAVADDEKEDPALTANLSSLAQALPELLERFRAMARAVGQPDESPMTAAQPAQTIELAAAMDHVVDEARAELEQRFKIMKLYAFAPPVLATEKQLGLMLMDHLVHAAQAVAPGRPDEHELQIRISTADDGWARLELTLAGPSV